MKQFVFLILLAILTQNVFAQTILVLPEKKEAPKKKPAPKQEKTIPPKEKQDIKPAPAVTNNTSPEIAPVTCSIKFLCDADATLYIDGESKGMMKKDELLKVQLPLGDHFIKAISATNAADLATFIYKITSYENDVIKTIALQAVIDKRQEATINKAQSNKTVSVNTSAEIAPVICSIKFLCDADATLYIDGKSKGQMRVDEPMKVQLPVGEYLIKAISTNNATDLVTMKYKVTLSENETIKEIALKEEIEKRQDAEQQAATEKKLKADQQAAAKKLLDIEMVTVTGGSFDMGSKLGEFYEKPIHRVTVSSFKMGKYEITQAQWKAVMGNNPSSHQGCDNCPVEMVSWVHIQEFLLKLNNMTGKSYRLPTEAEWEYAARGGSQSQHYTYAGSNNIDEVAWYASNSGSTSHTVGQKRANELGIYDMSGNVWECCSDWYGTDYYANSTGTNPQGPSFGRDRVNRGGCWSGGPTISRATHRYGINPGSGSDGLGFRLVSSL